nr:MAG TPA: hypothetical protein [Caudoviricetes sp.]DAV57819.1 MAG TPA: hypothetical protein [Caudoviricetes sp.]
MFYKNKGRLCTMEYNALEKQTLDILGRTDFKAIKKDEIVSITSMLSNMRPKVAKETIKQFPELANLLKSSLSEYKEMLSKIVESDDDSVQHVYGSADKAMDDATLGRTEFIAFAEKVRDDYSKCLDNEDLTLEEKSEILKGEMEILKMVDSKEKEVRAQQERILSTVDNKDSEKRQFNWKLVGAASMALVTVIGVGAAALGGKVDLKLPKKS